MRNFKTLALLAFILPTLGIQAKIIGKDDRLPVIKKSQKTEGIGVLYSKFRSNEGLSNCTATAIGSDYIMTAAHCVYDISTKTFAKEISFLPGLIKSAPNISDRYFVKKVHVLKDFAKQEANNEITISSDIAILKVASYQQKAVKEAHGAKEMKAFDRPGKDYDFYAFPGDKLDQHSLWREHGCRSSLSQGNKKIVETDCDTVKGMSGGALLDDRNNIVAINSSYTNDSKNNFFSALTFSRINSIQNIIQRGEDPAFLSKDLKATPYFSVHFRNNCAITVYVAVAYFEMGTGKTIIDGYFPVKAGQILYNVFKTDTTKLAFYAQDKTATLEWTAPEHRLDIRGQTKEFYAEKLPSVWKDKTYTWSCN